MKNKQNSKLENKLDKISGGSKNNNKNNALKKDKNFSSKDKIEKLLRPEENIMPLKIF